MTRAVGIISVLLGLSIAPALAAAQALQTVDIAELSTADQLRRVHDSVGDGSRGVPVAGGGDVDGDGSVDYAMASMQASVLGRAAAGEVYLLFGDGTVSGSLDTAPFQADILKIAGAGPSETAGSVLWMDDVTGDGLADLLVARQNYTHTPDDPHRTGAGALTILVGGGAVRSFAETAAGLSEHLDLRIDLILDEMLGDGLLPAAEDTGNLIVLSGAVFAPHPVPGLRPAGAALAFALILASGVAVVARRGRRARSGATT